jgi:hypothetical protein
VGALKVRTATGPDIWTTISGAVPVVELTQAAYDALVTKDPTTLYIITDGAATPSSGAFFKFDWSSTTTAPPATSGIRYNNATPASVTNIYMSYTAKDQTDLKTRLLMGMAGDRLYIQTRTNSAKYHIFNLSGTPTDNTTYATIPVTYSAGGTALADADEVLAGFIEASSSETYPGIVELATAAETLTGTANNLAIHPAGALATYAPKNILINVQVGTTYTLVLADAGKLITLNNASAITCTVPLNATVAFPVGTQIHLFQLGAGKVTVAATGGVTIASTPSLVFRATFSSATLIKLSTDYWAMMGDTT